MPVEPFPTSALALMVVMERPGWALGHVVPLKVGLEEDQQLAPLWGGWGGDTCRPE